MARHLITTTTVLISISFTPAIAQLDSGHPDLNPKQVEAKGLGTAGPDVIVSEIYQSRSWGEVGDMSAFSIGTISCNFGDAQVMWVASNNQHPVITQNLFRLKDGRFEHLGQSWIKHGFMALSEDQCGLDCIDPNDGARLGVGCSDPYTAALNGQQSILGAKSEVNAFTGYFPFPRVLTPAIQSLLDRRIQVRNSDIDPALNGGAVYVVESHYVSADDAAAGNAANNASWREATFVRIGNVWTMALLGVTAQQDPAIRAWRAHDSSVTETYAAVPNEGIFILSAQALEVASGIWDYEYALYNLNSDRSARLFEVPRPDGALIEAIGFHDVDYHSGEIYDGTDWTPTVDSDSVGWSTDDFATDPNANALRWNTLYNFRFRSNSAPGTVQATIGLFKPGTPASMSVETVGPAGPPPVCGDHLVEGPEECDPPDSIHCDATCGWICGDSVVHAGEECDPPDGTSCDATCRWMCGDGIVQSAEECDDAGESAACDADCTFAECGDERLNASSGEECDTGGASESCDADCTAVACGDGLLNAAAGEECDPPQSGVCYDTCRAARLDDCQYAPLVCTGTHPGSTIDATNDGVSSCGASATAPDTWFRYIPPSNGIATFETCGSPMDTVLAVHAGCPGTLGNQLACNDDDCILQSRITLNVVAGTEYLIRVAGYAGLMGDFSLKVSGPPCGCAADSDCLQPPGQCQWAVCIDSQCVLEPADDAPCNDGNTVSGDGCSATCTVEPGWTCVGLLPSVCTTTCGDGIQAGAEVCDDGNNFNGDGCSATCQSELCGNGVCETGETSCNCPGDCGSPSSAVCGNGTCEAGDGEDCRNCPADCNGRQYGTYSTWFCCGAGGGVNPVDCSDLRCSANWWTCTTTSVNSCCGDGILSPSLNEACDDGNNDNCDGCRGDCSTIESTCGDGTVDMVCEQCDDGNNFDGDGCSVNCLLSYTCGNGVLEAGEQCDDGNTDDCDGCRGDCSAIEGFCGDGLFDSACETCDDGVSNGSGDGVCLSDCSGIQVCGDGSSNGTEECDDGNTTGGDGCDATCQDEFCGDGIVNDSPNEECDDENNYNGDGCSADCQLQNCGDSAVDPGEQCDDGNRDNGDGCDATCNFEYAGAVPAVTEWGMVTLMVLLGFALAGMRFTRLPAIRASS